MNTPEPAPRLFRSVELADMIASIILGVTPCLAKVSFYEICIDSHDDVSSDNVKIWVSYRAPGKATYEKYRNTIRFKTRR